MSDTNQTPAPPPPPPPPVSGGDGDQPGAMKRTWAKYRGWPLWAQITIGILVLIILAGIASGGEDEEPVAAVDETTTTEEVEETPTTTTEATTTTTEATTTTTEAPTTTLSPEQEREVAVIAMGLVFEESRDLLAETLDSLTDVETVDRLAYENETVIVDITSTWASPDNQHDGAWNIMKGFAVLWDPDDGNWYQKSFSPNLQLINSGRVYTCPGDFMVQMADLRAGRSEWETTCS